MKKFVLGIVISLLFVDFALAEVDPGYGRVFVDPNANEITAAAVKCPIVLVHGLGGQKARFNTSYWPGLVPWISSQGGRVLEPDLGQYTPFRIQAKLLEKELNRYGADCYNIIGHSKGGVVARELWKISKNNTNFELKNIVTIGSPHQGTALGCVDGSGSSCYESGADFASFAQAMFTQFGNTSNGVFDENGNGRPATEEDVQRDIASLSTANMNTYNQQNHAGLPFSNMENKYFHNPYARSGRCHYTSLLSPQIFNGRYKTNIASWTGIIYPSYTAYKAFVRTVNVSRGEAKAIAPNRGDPTYTALRTAKTWHGRDVGNDGAVSVCSSVFGRNLGLFAGVDHADEIGQLTWGWGLKDSANFIRTYIRDLKRNGY
jgi:triacylglycerol lipase